MEHSVEHYWQECQPFLQNTFTSVVYESWIKTLKPIKLENDVLYLETTDSFAKGILEQRYINKLNQCIRAATEMDMKTVFISPDEQEQSPKPKKTSTITYETNLKSKYIFESFVRGKSNSLAFAAALAVSEAPGKTKFNPLFLYGGVGLGKTHLMHSIGNHIIKQEPDTKILYTSSENFTNEFITSIRKDRNAEFRNKYREIDVLLIDDIQFISDKEGTQEELFHTFNTLYDSNRQIVISSDQPPVELKSLEERLRSRFGSGLIVDITPPDFETRMAILEKKAEMDNINVSKEVLDFIARNIVSNIRELEGALNKVAAYTKLSNTETTMELAEKVLRDLISEKAKREVTVEYILDVVANYYNITPDELRSKKRTQSLTFARHVAMYLSRKILGDSLTQIGASFGGRDHSTIIHGCNKITYEMENDGVLKDLLFTLEKKIKGQ